MRRPYTASERESSGGAPSSADGNAGNDAGKRLESNAKNDFCETAKSLPIQYSTFKRPQAATDRQEDLLQSLKIGRDALLDLIKLPNGRKLGEGTTVSFVSFLHDAHYSNTGKGELVNCKRTGQDANDIHIELVM